jgi:hypothetical protein
MTRPSSGDNEKFVTKHNNHGRKAHQNNMPISINLNVKKLDKDRFVKGKKGTYANLVLWETDPDSESAEYGDYIVKQQGEKGDKMPILGNGKVYKQKGKNARKTRKHEEDDDDEIPF